MFTLLFHIIPPIPSIINLILHILCLCKTFLVLKVFMFSIYFLNIAIVFFTTPGIDNPWCLILLQNFCYILIPNYFTILILTLFTIKYKSIFIKKSSRFFSNSECIMSQHIFIVTLTPAHIHKLQRFSAASFIALLYIFSCCLSAIEAALQSFKIADIIQKYTVVAIIIHIKSPPKIYLYRIIIQTFFLTKFFIIEYLKIITFV